MGVGVEAREEGGERENEASLAVSASVSLLSRSSAEQGGPSGSRAAAAKGLQVCSNRYKSGYRYAEARI